MMTMWAVEWQRVYPDGVKRTGSFHNRAVRTATAVKRCLDTMTALRRGELLVLRVTRAEDASAFWGRSVSPENHGDVVV